MRKKLSPLEKEWIKVEKQEQAVAALDGQIAAAASDYQELARLMEEKTAEDERYAEMMERWEALSIELEEMQ